MFRRAPLERHPQACLDLFDRSQMIEAAKRGARTGGDGGKNWIVIFQYLFLCFSCWYFLRDEKDHVRDLQLGEKNACPANSMSPCWYWSFGLHTPLSCFYLVKEWVYPAGLPLISRHCPTGGGETEMVGRKVVMFHKRDSHGVKPRHCYNWLLFQ